jgi:uncharacterized membrane protein
MTQELLHFIDRALVISHVVFGTTALVIGPIAMLTAKGGTNHRRAGKIYFWGMAGIFASTLALAFFRFNAFLFIINIMSFYACFTGYRVLYRKNQDKAEQKPKWMDWLASSAAALAGIGFVLWGIGGLTGIKNEFFYPFQYPFAFFIIGLVAGSAIANSGVTDLISYTRQPTSKRWWWYEHMNRFLSGYIATVTAFLVQNVASRMPFEFSWIVWVAPGVIGGVLIAKWIRHYKSKFGDAKQKPQAAIQTNPQS